MLSKNLVYLLATISSLSCSSLSNRVDEIKLECGMDYTGKNDYLTVQDPEGRRLSNESVEMFDLEAKKKITGEISTKGCINRPKEKHLLITSKVASWATILNNEDLPSKDILKLQDYSGENLSIICDEKKPISVNNNFSIDHFFDGNISEELRETYKIEYEIQNIGTKKLFSGVLNLKEIEKKSQLFQLITEEGQYRIKVRTKNFLYKKESLPKLCLINLDKTLPDINFSINQKTIIESKFSYNNVDFVTVNTDDQVSFTSEDFDTAEVEYCLVEIKDNFTSDGESERLWNSKIKFKNCEGLKCKNSDLI